jgi:3-oxoacyl-[acyl-carrier protein] reductase
MMEERTAIVTGGGRGIGRSVAEALARDGCRLALTDLNLADMEETASALEKHGQEVRVFEGDVSDAAQAAEVVRKTVEAFGRADILVNNAGITRDSLFMRMKEADWDLVLAVNLKGTYNFCRAAAPVMVKQRYGRIVNISSVVGVMGNAGQANYSASKAGVIGLTKSLARELASRDITVNAVAPGFIDTAMTRDLPEKAREALFREIPLGRLGQPEDVAGAVRFLVSDEAAYITGHVLHVNGGLYI